MSSLRRTWSVATGILLALALLYVPDMESQTRWLRFIALIAVCVSGALLLVIERWIVHDELKRSGLPVTAKVLAAGLLVPLLITWLRNVGSHDPVYYAGLDPEYLGYVGWILCFGIGLLFFGHIQHVLRSVWALGVAMIIIAVSLVYDWFAVRHGLRLAGVFYQPLSLAVFANGAVVMALRLMRRYRFVSWSALLASIAVVLLCQSKLGLLLLVANLLLWIWYGAGRDRRLQTILLALVLVAVALPLLAPSYFSQLRSESLGQSASYKSQLYRRYVPELTGHYIVYGHGPAALPRPVNNQNYVPETITKSLGAPTRASANHDTFFDVSYFFGLLAGGSLLCLNVYAVRRYYQTGADLAVLLFFVTLLVNAITNAPSLELTPLYFAVLFSLCGRRATRQGAENV